MGTNAAICACYVILAIGGYIAWPSRWNIVAHSSLAFSIVAFVIPIMFLDQLDQFPRPIVNQLQSYLMTGTLFFVVALLFGIALANLGTWPRLTAGAARLDRLVVPQLQRRLVIAMCGGVLITAVAAFMMGGFPLFAADPYTAKYLRGDYQADSGLTSILYRLGTSILTVLPPISIALAIVDSSRRGQWVVLSGISLFLMTASMLRGPLAEGALIAILAWLISRRHYGWSAALLAATYLVGAIFYSVLDSLGVTSSQGGVVGMPFWESVAAGVPDVADTINFLYAWIAQGMPLTQGKTMWGGLVPGQYEWNAAVWSLVTTNFGADINSIRSGGLRLPVPIWGAAIDGTRGVIVVSALIGFLTGLVTRIAARCSEKCSSIVGLVVLLMVYSSALEVVAGIYALSYLDVVKAVVLAWVLVPVVRASRRTAGVKAPSAN